MTRRGRVRFRTAACLLVAWQVLAGAAAPLALRLAAAATDPASQNAGTSPETCPHHAMPGAMCPMHAAQTGQKPASGACQMTECDSLAVTLFALLASGAPVAAIVAVDAPSVRGERLVAYARRPSSFGLPPFFRPPRA